MTPDWAPAATIVASVGAVLVSGAIGRASSRQQFLRERITEEIRHRREVYSAFQKALWGYAGRAKTAVDLLEGRTQLQAGEQFRAFIRFDFAATKRAQIECRDALADLVMFASAPVQNAARAGLEGLTAAVNSCARDDLPAARAAYGDYEATYTGFATLINEELQEINGVLYVLLTPIWRAILRSVLRKPLPFEATETPSELRDLGPNAEGVVMLENPPTGSG